MPVVLGGIAGVMAYASPAIEKEVIRQGPITVIIRYVPTDDPQAYDYPPKVEVRYRGRRVAYKMFEDTVGKPHVRIAEMDPANITPEVIVITFSGGMHCCAEITVASALPEQENTPWRLVPLGEFDGNRTDTVQDYDGDGLLEVIENDGRFKGVYTNYNFSPMPPLVLAVRNGRKENLTGDPAFRPLLEERAAELRRTIVEASQAGESSNAALAAYVAIQTLLGRSDEAWQFLQRHYTPQELTICPVPKQGAVDCPVPEEKRPFPQHLWRFLQQTGYIRS